LNERVYQMDIGSTDVLVQALVVVDFPLSYIVCWSRVNFSGLTKFVSLKSVYCLVGFGFSLLLGSG